jgi:hypothetical protein
MGLFKKRSKQNEAGEDVATVETECVSCLGTESCISTASCKHGICKPCLGSYITITQNSRMPCPCPAECQEKFTIDDITPFVEDEVIGKIWYTQATIRIEKGKGMYCPNTACSKPILWKQAVKRPYRGAKCRGCGEPVCIRCKVAYHKDMS